MACVRGSVEQRPRGSEARTPIGSEAWLIREPSIRVAGGGRRNREFRSRPFGHRGLAPGFRRLKAERLMPVAVTRHLE